ncbi:MAG: HNH endonuclease [Clostridiales bacterium]|nr:HNH endonuclease [Clostridiales bacterium]
MKEEKREKNRKYDQYVREEEIVKFYHSREWKKVREAVLIRDNYLCQNCIKDNIIKSAEIVHHIVEIKDDWSKRLSISNCKSLCLKCHNSIHF